MGFLDSLFGPTSLPSSPTSQQTSTSTPSVQPWAQPYISDYLNKAQSLIANQETPGLLNQSYVGAANLNLPSGFAQGAALAQAGGQGSLSTAPIALQYGQRGAQYGEQGTKYGEMGSAMGQVAARAGDIYGQQATSPAAMQAYMSPYMQNVVDYQKQQAVRDFAKQTPLLQAQAAAAGAFGGSRQNIMQAEAQRALNTQLQGIEALGQAMAEGAKGTRWYEASAGFGKGYFDTTAKQRELNNKQDEAFINYQTAKEKEDDARRRGNVKDVVDAADKTQKLKIDYMNAESQRIHAMKPSQLAEQVQLFNKNPELFNRLYPKENPLVVSAAKHYFENELLLKKEFPTVNDYVASKVSGGGFAAGANPPSGPSAPPQAAIDALKKDPSLRKQFDDKYGPGASKRYLG